MPAAPSPATGTAKPHQTQQTQESLPGSSLPCRQGMPTATSLQSPVQPGGSTSSQDIPTKNSPMHSQFTPQGVTRQTSPNDQQSPVRTKNNSLSQNSIPAPEATMSTTTTTTTKATTNPTKVHATKVEIRRTLHWGSYETKYLVVLFEGINRQPVLTFYIQGKL